MPQVVFATGLCLIHKNFLVAIQGKSIKDENRPVKLILRQDCQMYLACV